MNKFPLFSASHLLTKTLLSFPNYCIIFTCLQINSQKRWTVYNLTKVIKILGTLKRNKENCCLLFQCEGSVESVVSSFKRFRPNLLFWPCTSISMDYSASFLLGIKEKWSFGCLNGPTMSRPKDSFEEGHLIFVKRKSKAKYGIGYIFYTSSKCFEYLCIFFLL